MPARTRDEHGCDNEENDHRVLDGERIRDERTANIRGARMEAFGREQSRESEERPLIAFKISIGLILQILYVTF